MTPRPLLALLLLAVAACAAGLGPDASGTADLPPSSGPTQVFRCGGERIVARPEGDAVRLALPDRTVVLPQVRSASGARYAAGGIAFWSKGDAATVETPARDWPDCRLVPGEGPWADAALRGIDFRAFGHEPGWVVEIDRGRRILVLADYGERRVTVPDSDPPGRDGTGPIIHHGAAGGHEATVAITMAPCVEPSGRTLPATATLRLDGRAYQGCGRFLD